MFSMKLYIALVSDLPFSCYSSGYRIRLSHNPISYLKLIIKFDV